MAFYVRLARYVGTDEPDTEALLQPLAFFLPARGDDNIGALLDE
jgi:hypothetical protein